MAFNFNPLTYTPYSQTMAMPQADYQGTQLQGLMNTINMLGESPMATGRAYENIPQFSPFAKTRQDYTTGGGSEWGYGEPVYDEASDSWDTPYTQGNDPKVFDQQGYLDARFGNINDYLGKLTNFFGGIGNNPAMQAQQVANQYEMNQAAMPQVGSMGNYGGTPTAGGLSGFAQTAPGGWGGRQVSGGGGAHPVVGGLLG